MQDLNIDVLIDRVVSNIRRTSWRMEVGPVDPEVVNAATAGRTITDDHRRFLERVSILENREGDVVFATARDLADPSGDLRQRLADWQHHDEDAVRSDAGEFALVHGFWSRITPVVASTVNGEDLIAVDPERRDGTVIEALGDKGWAFSTRPVATSFTTFFRAFAILIAAGAAGFDYGYRIKRELLAELRQLDPGSQPTSVPIVFDADFDTNSPPRRPTRRRLRAQG